MKKHLIGAAMLASLLTATPVQAEETARAVLEKIDGPNKAITDFYTIIMQSYGFGIQYSNVYARTKIGQPLYCQPENLALTGEQQVSMVRRYLQFNPKAADSRAGLVLLMAYLYTFPCDKPE